MDVASAKDVPEADFKEHLKGGKYGLECVLNYISIACKHKTWNTIYDDLLAIKLEKIANGLIKSGATETLAAPCLLSRYKKVAEGKVVAKQDRCRTPTLWSVGRAVRGRNKPKGDKPPRVVTKTLLSCPQKYTKPFFPTIPPPI
ncbi:hypothetical protein DFH28DRAFT_932701 [Melampsora americana]|nr:hypothetical protein DFH28DRAFT_932701 [Melampsora americana]